MYFMWNFIIQAIKTMKQCIFIEYYYMLISISIYVMFSVDCIAEKGTYCKNDTSSILFIRVSSANKLHMSRR